MTPTRIALAALLAILLAATGTMLARARDRLPRRPLAIALAALAAVAVLRLALAVPSFVHANLHGAGLVDGILGFPAPASHRATYGQASYLVLGAIAAAVGRRFAVVAVANQLLSVVALGAMAWLARRWSTRGAAWAVLAIGALDPTLVRIGASEDAHTLGLVFAWLGLALLDLYAASRRVLALVAAVAALVLLAHTRQTFYLWLPGAFALSLARDRRLLRDARWWLAGVLVAAALAQRVLSTVGDDSEQTTLVLVPLLLRAPHLLVSMLRFHPLLDVTRFGPVVPLALAAGVVTCLRRRGPTRALVGLTLAYFVLTLAFSLPTPGVELSFRVPVASLGIVVAGIGGALVVEKLRLRAPIATGIALACALAPLAWPAWRVVRTRSTDFAEYQAVERLAPSLPRTLGVVVLDLRDPAPAYQAPLELLHQAGVTAHRVSARFVEKLPSGHEPLLLVAGTQCWGYGLGELEDLAPDRLRRMSPDEIARFAAPVFDRTLDLGSLHVPMEMRRDCAAIAARGRPLGDEVRLPVVQDVPFVLYGGAEVPLRFYLVE